jgi:hypothetical protein
MIEEQSHRGATPDSIEHWRAGPDSQGINSLRAELCPPSFLAHGALHSSQTTCRRFPHCVRIETIFVDCIESGTKNLLTNVSDLVARTVLWWAQFRTPEFSRAGVSRCQWNGTKQEASPLCSCKLDRTSVWYVHVWSALRTALAGDYASAWRAIVYLYASLRRLSKFECLSVRQNYAFRSYGRRSETGEYEPLPRSIRVLTKHLTESVPIQFRLFRGWSGGACGISGMSRNPSRVK